jgi:lipoate-protein ligase A
VNLEKCKEQNLPVVKRPTGGRAIMHSEEQTYSVIAPADSELGSLSVSKSYFLISSAIIMGLRILGADPKFTQGDKGYIHNPSCFSSSTSFEIAIDGKKFVGSAQKRLGRSLLQHGSILTGPDYKRITEFLDAEVELDKSASLSEFFGKAPLSIQVENALIKGFESYFDAIFIPFSLSSIY